MVAAVALASAPRAQEPAPDAEKPIEERVKPYLTDPALAGLWHHVESDAWIRIYADAVVYQCRPSLTLDPVYSDGFVIGWIAIWDRGWPTQAASVVDGGLLLIGGPQRLIFKRAFRMETRCADSAPRLEPPPG